MDDQTLQTLPIEEENRELPPEQEPADALAAYSAQRDALCEEIAALKEQEAILAERLALAKDRGLDAQASQCRRVLQRIVGKRTQKQEDLKVVLEALRRLEAKAFLERFSEEVDTLTTQIERDFLDIDPEAEAANAPSFEPDYDYEARAKRLSFISKTFGWVGILAGLVGAVVYLLLSVLEVATFSWIGLGIFGGVTAVLVLVGLIFGAAANHQRKVAARVADELAEQKAAYEAECEERRRLAEEAEKEWIIANAAAIAEAYSIEAEGDKRRAVKKSLQQLIPDLSDPEQIKKTARKLAPIAAVCAVVTVAAVAAGSKKRAAAKKTAALRREFFKWLV